jgi:peptide/nickel transport system permease protein
LFLGLTAALYRNTAYDRVVNAATLTTISTPEFFVAYILILFFASLWPVFPSLANVDASTALAKGSTG